MRCKSCLLLAVLCGAAGAAEPVDDLYSQQKLAQEKVRLERRIRELWTRAVQPNLPPVQQRLLQDIQFEFPLVGAQRSVLDFYADSQARKVYMPIVSLLFLEDLATAYAWLWAKGYKLDTIDEYVAMLKYRKPADMPGGRFPPPLSALHIPDNALSDKKVDGLSLRFRNSAYAFVLCHEVGHVLYQHPGYQPNVPRRDSRANEAQADELALSVLRRTSTIPMGALLYFQASAGYFVNRGDFDSDQKWEQFLETEATHPLTADRISRIAVYLRDNVDGFLTFERDRAVGRDLVLFVANGMEVIGQIMSDPQQQRLLAFKGSNATVESLRPRR